MRKVFTGMAGLLMAAVVVQFFLAGSGAFDTAPRDEAFGSHESMGHFVLLLTIVVTIVGAVAKVPRRLLGVTGLVAALTLLQPVIAGLANAVSDGSARAGALVFGLHAVNGLIIMALLGSVLRRSRQSSTTSGGRAEIADPVA